MRWRPVLLLIFSTAVCAAQDIIPLEDHKLYSLEKLMGKYLKDVNGVFDKFSGTWHYQDRASNPTRIFEVTFYKKEKRSVGEMYYTDEMETAFLYIEKGDTVYNTYASSKRYYISGSYADRDNLNKLLLSYSEPVTFTNPRNQFTDGHLELVYKEPVNGAATLLWSVSYFEGRDPEPFLLPLDMVLYKKQ